MTKQSYLSEIATVAFGDFAITFNTAILLDRFMSKTTCYSTRNLTRKHEHFATLYKNFALPLTKFLIKKMGGDQHATEEVFSQTILAAWKGWHTFESRSTYFTWLCRIALNKMADYYRDQVNERSRRVYPTLKTWANVKDQHLTPEEKACLEELRKNVHECLDLLPPETRQLLYLRYWEEMTIASIADLLGISERAAEGKIYRARVSFREIYSSKLPK